MLLGRFSCLAGSLVLDERIPRVADERTCDAGCQACRGSLRGRWTGIRTGDGVSSSLGTETIAMPNYAPLRVAIIGCGNISAGYARSLKTRPDKVTLLGATDVDPARASAFVETHGGTAYPDLGAVLAEPQVEAMINLTSHHAHASVTCAA